MLVPPIFNAGVAASIWNGLAGVRLRRSDYQVLTPDDYDRIAAEIIALQNQVSGAPSSVTITNGAGGSSNICLVTFTLLDALGVALTYPVAFDVFLSDAATGAGLTATAASGAVAAGASGADFGDMTAKKAKRVQCNASGVYILSITDTGKTLFYPCAQLPGKGATVGAQLTSGSYHA